MLQKKQAILLILLANRAFSLFGQDQEDSVIIEKLRSASGSNPSISASITHLADIYGPRLLGTINYFKAARWAKQTMKAFGTDTAYVESFDKGYRGWNVKTFNVEMTTPNYMHIVGYPLAYTQSTRGVVEGKAVLIDNPDTLPFIKGSLRGKILLLGDHFYSFNSLTEIRSGRLPEDILQQAAENPDPNDLLIGYHSRRHTNQAIADQEQRRVDLRAFFEFCETEGVLALIEPSDYPYGILHADGNHHVPSYRKVGEIKPIASFVIANEQFGRLVRLIQAGITPTIKLNLQTAYNYNPEFNVNVIADINGVDSKLSDEQVIIGAHLDSWHSGTGAVDNAAGVAVMMEAIRIIKAAGLRPKRIIKICLWGGEEQIFAGSGAYVNDKVGDLKSGLPKKDFHKISAYFNLDNGAGRIRGIYAQGNSKAKTIFENMLSPFKTSGSNTVTIQYANQTDHELFDMLNIPAFQFIQDPLNYISAVHHTNIDVAEYVNKNDLSESAIIVAYVIYKVAVREEPMPRRDFISIQPNMQGNTTFFLPGFEKANAISIVSDFNNWNMFGTPLQKVSGGWTCKLDLKPGRYLYKYIIDGDWTADPKTPQDKLLKDGKGHAGLTEVIVR